METKHTKGEWLAKWNSSTYAQIENHKGSLIAIVDPYKKTGRLQMDFEEYNSNIKLITTAPKLLEALKVYENAFQSLLKTKFGINHKENLEIQFVFATKMANNAIKQATK